VSIWRTLRNILEALGLWKRHVEPVGCELGKTVYRETKRAAQLVNANRRARPLRPETIARLRTLFPDVDLEQVRVKEGCRLPANRFSETGSIYAMTFGHTIFWRDEVREDHPRDIVKLIHELVHVAQVERMGGEGPFSCAYGEGFLNGGGDIPAYMGERGAYEHNPLEAEAYSFEAKFRDEEGRIVPDSLPSAS
jgi:hypothetical protein